MFPTKLLLIFFLTTVGVNCLEDKALKIIESQILNFDRFKIDRPFSNVAHNPLYLHDKYNQIFATLYASRSAPIIMTLSGKKEPCQIESKSTLPYVGEYDAFVHQDKKIVVTLRSTSLGEKAAPSPNDKWEIFVIDPELCGHVVQPVESNQPGYYIEAMKLKSKVKNLDLTMKLSKKDTLGRFQSATLNYFNSDFYEFKYVSVVENGTAVMDGYTNAAYIIDNNNGTNNSIHVEPLYYPYAVGSYLDLGRIDDVSKALAIDDQLLTFCHSSKLKNFYIKCHLFGKKSNFTHATSLFLSQQLEKMFVFNLDDKSAIIFWVEQSVLVSGYDVMAQILQRNVSWSKQKVFHSDKKIDFIKYKQGFGSHCLIIAAEVVDLQADSKEFCFYVLV